MRSCSFCGSQYPDHAHFCGHCGTLLSPPQQGQVAVKETLQYPLVPLKTFSNREKVAVKTKLHRQNSIYDSNDAGVPSQRAPTPPVNSLPPDYPEYPTMLDAPSTLDSQRQTVLEDLLSLISFVDEAHRAANQEQFECNITTMPPIEDDSWGRIAFITGIYGRYMWKQPLSSAQKICMWRALIWSVRYEQYFRPKLVNDRSAELFIFLNGASHDQDFLSYATQDVVILIKELHIATIKKLNERLVKLPQVSQEIVAQFRTLIEKRLAATLPTTQPPVSHIQRTATPDDSEFEQIIQAIDQCWSFLDKKAETSNHALFQQARYMLNTPGGQKNLTVLAGSIVRQALHRYLHESSAGSLLLPDQQLKQVILLAQFVTSRSTDPYIEYSHFLLTSLQSWRAQAPNAFSFIDTVKKRYTGVKVGGHIPGLWTNVVRLITHYLAERRIAHIINPAEAEEWMQAISDLPDLSPVDQKRFLVEARRHSTPETTVSKKIQEDSSKEQDSVHIAQSPLTILGEERGKEFLNSIRNSQLDRTEAILQDARQPLLLALCQFLANTSFTEIQPPRRPLHIRNKRGEDLFPNARNYITDSQPDLWREALSVFEQGERETTRKDFKAIACEWSLFAQARVNGPVRVVPSWEEHRHQSTASWEEIWNLAAFYAKVAMFPRALDVLEPGVTAQQAPFAHLRFSLYCSAQILAHADKEQADSIEQATSFLITHLTTLPYPLCYLVWLLLTHEHQQGKDFIERLQILSLFQEILERPIIIPQPEVLHDNVTLETIEKNLRHLKLDITWYIWIQDYAERHPYIRKAWQSLAEACEQAGYIEQTAKALQHIARIQIEQYQHHSHKGIQPPDLRYLRATLIKLFEFYRRHEMTANSNAAFHTYYRAVPEL
ncbi:MAG TPA: zinc ribbon domain-containing protein, partial [Ktedonobacteraceae bacterium]